MNNLKIGTRIIIGFASITLISIALGLFAFSHLNTINDQTTVITADCLPMVYQAGQVQYLSRANYAHILEHINAETRAEKELVEAQLKETDSRIDSLFKEVDSAITIPDERKMFDKMESLLRGYKQVRDAAVLSLSRELKSREAITEVKNQVDPAFTRFTDALDQFANFNKDGADEASRTITTAGANAKLSMLIGLAMSVAIAIVISILATLSITRPLARALEVIDKVAHEDLTAKLDVTSRDEIGRMARGLNSLVDQLRSIQGVLTKVAQGDLRTKLEASADAQLGSISTAVNTMVDGLRRILCTVGQNAYSLADASHELSAVSTQVSSNAEKTSEQSNVVSAAAEQVSRNMQTVATAAEQMSASVDEISKNATEASKIATHAASVANKTNQVVAKLGDSSAEIGNVIKVITSIAEQTNLLALNATIEAARAGEAGKGFAVVANEVKELAKQTAKATEDIGQKISAIQTDTQQAVGAIQEIGGIIRQINEIQTVIAGAVEEQAATTKEISKNASEAAQGSGEITQNIASVAEGASGTSEGATNTANAANALSQLSADLQKLFNQFQLDGADASIGHAHSLHEPNNGQPGNSHSDWSGPRRSPTVERSGNGSNLPVEPKPPGFAGAKNGRLQPA